MKKKLKTILTTVFIIASLTLWSQNSSNALNFDGVNDYADVSGTALNNIGTNDFTLEAWIKGDDESVQDDHPIIFSNRTGTQTGGIMFFFHDYWGGSQYKMLCLQMESKNYLIMDNGTYNNKILDGTCHHVAVTKQSDTLKFYVDGSFIGARTVVSGADASSSASIKIGHDVVNNNYFKGEISQVRIWDVARTESDITNDKGFSIDGNTTNLMSYWELNDDGQIIADKTGGANGQLGSTANADINDPQLVTNSCEVKVLTTGIAGVFGIDLKVYPNPTKSVINIEISESQEVSGYLILRDNLGRVVKSESFNTRKVQVDMVNVEKGIYFLEIGTSDKKIVKKLVKE